MTPLHTGTGAIPGAHYVFANPSTLRWGRLPTPGATPVANDGPHAVLGPVAVTGAAPGDVVCIEPVEPVCRVDYGIVSNRHGRGVLAGAMPLPGVDGHPPAVAVHRRSHYAQGNGEVALTAFEAPLRASVRVTLLQGVEARRLAALMGSPWGETATHTIIVGLDATLDGAMRDCVQRAVAFVVEVTDADPASALAFLSAAADFEVSQAVNLVVGVHCLIRSADLR